MYTATVTVLVAFPAYFGMHDVRYKQLPTS